MLDCRWSKWVIGGSVSGFFCRIDFFLDWLKQKTKNKKK